MSNRFERETGGVIRKIVSFLPIGAFIALFIGFLYGINTVGDTTRAKQLESLETALSRCIIQCYAVEGTYPPNLEYLKEHYGLTYNEDLFWVHYEPPFGSNMMPDYEIEVRSGQ